MNHKKTFFFWLTSLILTFFIGFYTANKTATETQDSDEIIRKNFNYKYINPIIECNPDISQNNNLTPIKNEIIEIISQEKIKKNISFASIYFRDLNNGPWFGINEKEYFAPASLVKVPILIAYLKKAETQIGLLQQKIPLKILDIGDNIQNIKPSVSLAPNQEYTIEELIEKMIVYSDNDAYNTLANNLTSEELIQVYEDLSVDISKAFTNPNGNIITVKDYASFFRILFNASYLNKDMSEKALNLLTQTQFKNGLVAGVSSNISIAHKFGERKFLDTGETQFHDCGIVYLPKKPYLLCIMTRGNSLDNAEKTIKNISQKIFQYLESASENK